MYIGYGNGIQSLLYLALLGVLVLSLVAQGKVQRTFQKYSQERAESGKTAAQMASELLDRYRGEYIQIEPVQGRLTDHVNPKEKTVGLSEAVYGQSSVAALAVAAHEIGHVLQYQEDYAPIRVRNAILPVASIGSSIAPWIVILGVLFNSFNIAIIGVVLFGAVLLFQLATLPAEFNASSRALRMLEEGNYVSYTQSDDARRVLRAAAMTYVWATVGALISFLRLLLIASSSRRRD